MEIGWRECETLFKPAASVTARRNRKKSSRCKIDKVMVMAWLGNPRRIFTGLGAQFYGVFPPSKVVMGESGRMQEYRLPPTIYPGIEIS